MSRRRPKLGLLALAFSLGSVVFTMANNRGLIDPGGNKIYLLYFILQKLDGVDRIAITYQEPGGLSLQDFGMLGIAGIAFIVAFICLRKMPHFDRLSIANEATQRATLQERPIEVDSGEEKVANPMTREIVAGIVGDDALRQSETRPEAIAEPASSKKEGSEEVIAPPSLDDLFGGSDDGDDDEDGDDAPALPSLDDIF